MVGVIRPVGTFVILCAGMLSAVIATAEDQYGPDELETRVMPQVVVGVRTLKASNPIEADAVSAELAGAALPIEIDGAIEDLRSKLQMLQFRTFHLLVAEDKVIPITRRETFTLTGGQTLTVRPLYVERGKIGLWIKWQDSSGASVLDTRMHLMPGENVLTGTDHASNCGLILAIAVRPE